MARVIGSGFRKPVMWGLSSLASNISERLHAQNHCTITFSNAGTAAAAMDVPPVIATELFRSGVRTLSIQLESNHTKDQTTYSSAIVNVAIRQMIRHLAANGVKPLTIDTSSEMSDDMYGMPTGFDQTSSAQLRAGEQDPGKAIIRIQITIPGN